MNKLTDFYTQKAALQEKGETASTEWDALEERLIREEVMPELLQQLKATLSQVKCPLMLNVSYDPNGALAVSFTRNCMQMSMVVGGQEAEKVGAEKHHEEEVQTAIVEDAKVLNMFKSLNRNKVGSCYAPHKAVMLLAIMELVAIGHITSTTITLDKELKDTFKKVWACTVPAGASFTCEYRNPFTYMDKSFWTLTTDRNVANISAEVFAAMKDANTRSILVSCLTDMIINDTVDDSCFVYDITPSTSISKAAEDLMIMIPFIGSCLSLLA